MPSLIDIRKRISSVKNTQQITKAMKMVSAAKLRRAQDNVFALRPYAQELNGGIRETVKTMGSEFAHPLLKRKSPQEPGDRSLLILVVTSDRGLCGGFN